MSTAIVKHEPSGALQQAFGAFSPAVLIEQIALVQQVMKDVMQNGHHYGTIPGCGDKPTLLKPGAEKLGFVFRLAPEFAIEVVDMGEGHRDYRIVCTLRSIAHQTVMGQGVGSCSTMEGKYRWRKAERCCPVCGKAAIIKGKAEYGGGWLCFDKKGGCKTKFADEDPSIKDQVVGQVPNPDIADTYNTVLKMAKKRAQIDAIITATAASDIFTQDIEDFAPDASSPAPEKPAATTPPAPRRADPPVVDVQPADDDREPDPFLSPSAPPAAAPRPTGPVDSDPEVWFGRTKGKRVSELSPSDASGTLKWCRETWTSPNQKQAVLMAALSAHVGGGK